MITAQLIRGARRESNLTQQALADRSGATQPSIADIERSAHDTRVENLVRLLAAAGHRIIALPTLARTVAEWGDYIRAELCSERRSEDAAFRSLIGLSDDLASAPETIRTDCGTQISWRRGNASSSSRPETGTQESRHPLGWEIFVDIVNHLDAPFPNHREP